MGAAGADATADGPALQSPDRRRSTVRTRTAEYPRTRGSTSHEDLWGSLGQFQRQKQEERGWACLTSSGTMDRCRQRVKVSSALQWDPRAEKTHEDHRCRDAEGDPSGAEPQRGD